MTKKFYKNQTDMVSSVNEPVISYRRAGSVIGKNQIISNLHAGIQALKAEQRGEYVEFRSLDDLIAELRN